MAMVPYKAPKKQKSERVATIREVKAMIRANPELKFFVTHPLNGSSYGGANQYDLCAIPQGDTDNQRDGDQIRARELLMNWSVNWGTGGVATQSLRVTVWRWIPSSTGSQPTYADIFQFGATFPINTMTNWDTRFQFKILYDKKVSYSAYQPLQPQVVRLNLGNKIIQWVSGSSTVKSGGIYLSVMSDSATLGGNVDLYTELMYNDA